MKEPTVAEVDPLITEAASLGVFESYLARLASSSESTTVSEEEEASYPYEYPLELHHWTSYVAPSFELIEGVSVSTSAEVDLFSFSLSDELILTTPTYADTNSSLLTEALTARKESSTLTSLDDLSLTFETELHYTWAKALLILRAKADDQSDLFSFILETTDDDRELTVDVWAVTSEWPRVRLSGCFFLPPANSQVSLLC